MKKRGVSKLLATVLLVGFTVVLIALIIIWGRHYLEERAAKEGAISQKQSECITNVEIDIVDASQTSVTLENKKQTIDAFAIRVTGDLAVDVVEPISELKPNEVETINFGELGVGKVKKIDVIPKLKVARGVYVPCSGQHVVYAF